MKIDQFNTRILNELQKDPDQPQRLLAERVGLSQNACWRRLKQLEQDGIIKGRRLLLDYKKLGKPLRIFMLVRTRDHSARWLDNFRRHVEAIPEITGFFRVNGNFDYLLQIIAADMERFDHVYQLLIADQQLETVTSYITMEAVFEDRPIPLSAIQ